MCRNEAEEKYARQAFRAALKEYGGKRSQSKEDFDLLQAQDPHQAGR
ncbi:hypothetical protein TO73_1219 [Thermus aquaticus Y51MC23]|uniref:Uncharacterized protein n=1 Tax=Thermus aquaticus (strain ATCC BAA-2747 / Y51MC23) TaxID=498848 RepID=A0ABN4IKX6_THEA5|nr:hypothetical protein TO73_1219 [Thermus aquaticus Y51MC23]